jgi:hypothetical protein
MTKTLSTFFSCFFLLTFSFAQAQPCGSNIVVTPSQTNVNCFGQSTGTAAVAVTGATGSVSYSWAPTNATTAAIANLAAGTYNCIITVGSSGGGTSTVIYNETFDATVNAWTLNTPTGVNGSDPNFWTVSDNEGGVLPPGCGVAGNGNNSLHITSVFNPAGGASYDAGGLCGFLFCPQTSSRAESGNISTVGATSLTLTFDYISVGDGLIDNASVVYSTNGGSTWATLAASIKSTVCANGQGQWTAASFPLPAACLGISNLRVGFNWVNNDDGAGSDPSVAVNNVKITDVSSTGGGSCTANATVTITQPTAALAASSTSNSTGCGNSVVTVSATGGTAPYVGTGSFSVTPGTYNYTVTDSKGCTSITTITVAPSAGMVITPTITNVLCGGSKTGEVSLAVAGGTPPYQYLWSNTQTTSSITSLNAGTYTCVVTDAAGCTASVSTQVTQNPPLLAITSATPPNGGNNGTATVTASGGVSPYAYLWQTTPPQTTQTATGLASGTYSVTVTDQNGCTKTLVAIVPSGVAIDWAELGLSNFSYYPNPAENEIALKANLIQAKAIHVRILDITGKEIWANHYNVAKELNEKIDISRIPAGIYLLNISTENGEANQKLLINR